MSSTTEGSNLQGKYKQVILGPSPVSIPEHWDVATLGEVTTIVSGSTPKKSNEEYWRGQIVWVTPTDVTSLNRKYLYDSEEKITEAGLNNSSATMIEPGAVLMTSRATIGEVVINKVPVTTNQGFKTLVPNEVIDAEYLYYYLPSVKQYLNAIGGGSTFSEISKTDVSGIKIPIPSLPEQRRIANILSTVDEQIQQTSEIIQKIEELKHGLMQDIFVQGIRDEEQRKIQIGPKEYSLPTSWKVAPAGDICNKITVGIVSGATAHYREDGVPFIRTKNIDENNINTNDMRYISPEFHQQNLSSELRSGDIITARTGDPGTTCVVPPEFDGANCFSLLITRTSDELDEKYFSYFMNSPYTTDFINSRKGGGVQKNLNVKFLRKLPVFLPSIKEQQKISSIISQVDHQYHDETKKKDNLQELKRGLMQDLLTGKKRVDPEET